MTRVLVVSLGGALGSALRYLVSLAALRMLGTGFPFGTLAVNVVGSFLIGLVMEVGLTTHSLPPTLRLGLATGVLGGFTTYSAFAYDGAVALRDGAWGKAAANVVVTLAGGLLACGLGMAAARWIGR